MGIGTEIVARAGPAVAIRCIDRRVHRIKVYNFTVEGAHTYFVGRTGGGIWAHNTLCPTGEGGFGETRQLVESWAEDPVTGRRADSIRYHFDVHGEEVGATNARQYLRKAAEFARKLKGQGDSFDGTTNGVARYRKSGNYIDIRPDGTIVSFGRGWLDQGQGWHPHATDPANWAEPGTQDAVRSVTYERQ